VLVVPSNRDTYLQAISLIVVSREPALAGKSFLKPTDTLVSNGKKMDVKRDLLSHSQDMLAVEKASLGDIDQASLLNLSAVI